MRIRQLSPFLVNQIAAGEVVERPASVVKELVENSLDAGAGRIDVQIEDGGKGLIRISDDGRGILGEDLPLAICAHATSKISTQDDLFHIGTMGFRGEALASIASISRLSIRSRAVGEDGILEESGNELRVEGGGEFEIKPVACGGGTVIEAKDLFFNTPARRKFLKASSAEFGQISDVLTRIAMVHYDVAFRVSHNGRKTMDLVVHRGEDARRRRCVDLLGKSFGEGVLTFEHHEQGRDGTGESVSVWGLAGLPSVARATSKFQYVCLNGRPIKDRRIQHALKEAYRGLMPMDKHPMAVVFIEMDPGMVDVNVHPAKTEVRFRDANQMHGLVLHSIRRCLLGADLTPAVSFDRRDGGGIGGLLRPVVGGQQGVGSQASDLGLGENGQIASENAATGEIAGGVFAGGNEDQNGVDGQNLNNMSQKNLAVESSGYGGGYNGGYAGRQGGGNTGQGETMQAFVNYFRRMDPKQKGFAYKQVREALADDNPEQLLEETVMGHGDGEALAPQPEFADKILQVHESYVVMQDADGMIIVDQHALHERVMFEKLKSRVLQGDLESQRLLMPVVMEESASRIALLEEMEGLLKRIGIEVGLVGPAAVGVQSFASFLFERKVEPVAFLTDLLDKAEEGKFEGMKGTEGEEAALHSVLDMMACKAAVKAGDGMSRAELVDLLKLRHEVDRGSNCPHGRPTTVRLSLRDLEKQFKRS